MPRLIILSAFLLNSLFAFSQKKVQSLKLSEYYDLLDEIADRADVDNDVMHPYSWRPDSLMAGLTRLPDTLKIVYKDNQGKSREKEVSNQWMKSTFEPNGGWQNTTYLDTLKMAGNLKERIEEYRSELEESWGSQSDTSASSAVKEILNDKRFEKEKKPEIDYRRNGMLSRGLRNQWGLMDSAPWILFGLMIVLLVYLMARMNSNVDFTKTPDDVPLIPGKGLLSEDDPTESGAMNGLARKARAEGNFEAAVRYYYLSFILLLHERKVISYKPSYTAWEYYTLLSDKKFPPQPVFEFTNVFDRSTYGKKTLDERSMQQYESNIGEGVGAITRMSS